MKHTGEMGVLGLDEIFTDSDAIVVVEWAERLGDLLPTPRTDIHFNVRDDGKHSIIITKSN
jgi:tRNA A37 threonylcarbamoyladenosine biosynthesis protein TsaE